MTDAQPNGATIEQTLEVVSHILADADFANEVVVHNGWVDGLSQVEVALLFLTSRYQSAVTVLSRQTDTLHRDVDGLQRRVQALEDRVFEPEE